MNKINGNYLKIGVSVIFTIVFVISSYIIIINTRHCQALSSEITVNEADIDYVNYKKNINDVETNLNKINKLDNNKLMILKNTLNVLKKDGVFRLMPNTKLSFYDLYLLNDYFLNDIINNSWVSSLKKVNISKKDEEMITVLTNNSMYLHDHFISNGLTLYDSLTDDIIQNDYEIILKNYLSFSNIILEMSKG